MDTQKQKLSLLNCKCVLFVLSVIVFTKEASTRSVEEVQNGCEVDFSKLTYSQNFEENSCSKLDLFLLLGKDCSHRKETKEKDLVLESQSEEKEAALCDIYGLTVVKEDTCSVSSEYQREDKKKVKKFNVFKSNIGDFFIIGLVLSCLCVTLKEGYNRWSRNDKKQGVGERERAAASRRRHFSVENQGLKIKIKNDDHHQKVLIKSNSTTAVKLEFCTCPGPCPRTSRVGTSSDPTSASAGSAGYPTSTSDVRRSRGGRHVYWPSQEETNSSPLNGLYRRRGLILSDV